MSSLSGEALVEGRGRVIGRRDEAPIVAVLSSLFPTPDNPIAGVFVRERMFRVARRLPLTVYAPRPWSPVDGLLRRWRPGFRVPAPQSVEDEGVPVHYPRFLSAPAVLKRWDGAAMARSLLRPLRRLQRDSGLDLIDAHFGYPDGYAAVLLGERLGVPVTVTFRGTEARLAREPWARRRLQATVRGAARVFTVSESLRALAIGLGAEEARTEVMANGVDTLRFRPRDRLAARRRLGLEGSDQVLVTVGGLCERKGQHRVIELLPDLGPRVRYLLVGGASGEGDERGRLQRLAARLGVTDRVHFLGSRPPDELPDLYSAADVSVLASSNEGWANVLLESLACGVPVVATDVGGNREVIAGERLGRVVPLGDPRALREAIRQALATRWDSSALRRHALQHDWEDRADVLALALQRLHGGENFVEDERR